MKSSRKSPEAASAAESDKILTIYPTTPPINTVYRAMEPTRRGSEAQHDGKAEKDAES